MKSETWRIIQNILINVCFLSIGLLFFVDYEAVWFIIYILTIAAMTLITISQATDFIKKKKPMKFKELIPGLSSFCFGLFIVMFPLNFSRFIHIVLGWYIFINAMIQMIDYTVYRRDSLKGASLQFVKSIIGFAVALSLIFVSSDRLWLLSVIIGSYFILHAIIAIMEDVKDLLPDNTQNKVRKHLTMSAPVLLAALIPQRFFFSLRDMTKQHKITVDFDPNDDDVADLEVFIYLKESGPESFGHVDICFENKIYSYGCHDPENRNLYGTLGDGVLIVANRNAFLSNAIHNEDKTIIGYNIKLTESQKTIIKQKIEKLMLRAEKWSSKAEIADQNNEPNELFNDYASRIYKTCKAKMVKFSSGKFKTYFVFSTNCVLLADYLIRTNDLDLIKVSGIVTPGAYISFLNQEFKRQKSSVINRTIYQRQLDLE